MKILEYLRTPEIAAIYLDALLAGLPVVLMCAALSVFVVVKRLGFVGQGVSHSAFGGVGVAAVLLAMGVLPVSSTWGPVAQFGVIVAFCLLAAWGIGMVSSRRTLPVDTAIGVFLVGSMAMGAILVQVGRELAAKNGRVGLVQSWESILFGSLTGAGIGDVWMSAVLASGVLLLLWWYRRPLLFWVLDEDSAAAFGIRTSRIKFLLMTLLAVTIVTAMKLTGVILATALLALPGAIALRVSSRLKQVLAISMASGVVSLVGGMVLSIETDWPMGPSVVAVLIGLFAATWAMPRAVRAA